jgi:hypothetical protein
MKILVAGNPNFGLAQSLKNALIDHELTFASRSSGYDLAESKSQERFASESVNYKVVILCSALYKFNQTVLLDRVYKSCSEANTRNYIICIGSTTDRVKKGGAWLYNAEKKALRDYCNTLGLNGVWAGGPKLTLISFGSLSNVQSKHPTRKCMNIDTAASYVKWLIDQPSNICVNEISIDPMQVPNE